MYCQEWTLRRPSSAPQPAHKTGRALMCGICGKLFCCRCLNEIYDLISSSPSIQPVPDDPTLASISQSVAILSSSGHPSTSVTATPVGTCCSLRLSIPTHVKSSSLALVPFPLSDQTKHSPPDNDFIPLPTRAQSVAKLRRNINRLKSPSNPSAIIASFDRLYTENKPKCRLPSDIILTIHNKQDEHNYQGYE